MTDRAGNVTTATSSAVNIDRTAPATAAVAPTGWQNTNVTVTLNATDALSGVASTSYSVDGGSTQTGTSVVFSTDGDHTLSFSSTDKAGNVEATHTVHVMVDKTAPTITHVLAPTAPNSNGWFNSDVMVTFSCGDATSGVVSCTGNTTVTTNGANQIVTGTATDAATNVAHDNVTLNIDKVPPTINAARNPAANGNGWNNTGVTVTFTCNDTLSGIPTGGCAAPVSVSAEGLGQSATGSATDAAGNSSQTTLGNINIDKTPPALTGAPTAAPPSNGWYHSDVTVVWSCSDALSGITGNVCPANSVVTGEGSNASATATISDRAGNSTTTTVSGIKIDRTAPTTTASTVPTSWTNHPVAVTLTATDNLSGVATTQYAVDGGSVQSGTALTLNSSGTHTVQFWSTDVAGNIETAHTLTVSIDLAPPTISHSLSPVPNAAGWNNSNTTVTFACADQVGLSGLATCTAPVKVAKEAGGQLVAGTATDVAGNAASDTVTVNVDKTPPTISGSATPAANGAGWNNTNVTVAFACSDALSGIKTCPANSVLSSDGANQSVGGNAVDVADNTASAVVSGINIDKTAPTLTGAPTTSANSNGWYSGDVGIAWSCSDALSGIAGSCPSASTITGEGSGLTASATVSDRAGNTTQADSAAVQIDRHAPVTTISSPSAWQNTDVTVTLSAFDALSGVAGTHYTVDGGAQQDGTVISLTSEGEHTITAWSVDNAGNVESAKTATVSIDKTAPTIVANHDPDPNGDGWNNTPVHVSFACADAGSGIASCLGETTVTTDGKNQTVTGTATDVAGNTATTPTTVSIDTVPPSIDATRSPQANAAGWVNTPVTVSFACSDALSGLKSCPTSAQIGEGANQSATGTAIDAAGNTAAASVTDVNVDLTAPTITGAATSSPNSDGWYNGDVTVHWTCDDNLSGRRGLSRRLAHRRRDRPWWRLGHCDGLRRSTPGSVR